ncbi:MAG: RidA family protein [Sphingomicrobium sp.]
MRIIFSGLIVLTLAGCVTAPVPRGEMVRRIGAAGVPISASVQVPPESRIVYVSGTVPDAIDPKAPEGSPARYGNTYAQTRSILDKIEVILREQRMGMEDIVMMRVFLVAPPGQARMDFAGMMRAYIERFGTAAQPNKPARSTMQVAGLVNPGWLAEIEVTAARNDRFDPVIIPTGNAR